MDLFETDVGLKIAGRPLTDVQCMGSGEPLHQLTGRRYLGLSRLASSEGSSDDSADEATDNLEGDVSGRGSIVALVIAVESRAEIAVFTPAGSAYYFCLEVDSASARPEARAWWAFAKRHYYWILRDKEQALKLGLLDIEMIQSTDSPEVATAAGEAPAKRVKRAYKGRLLARSKKRIQQLASAPFEVLLAVADSESSSWSRA
jgi:hypothetical protein